MKQKITKEQTMDLNLLIATFRCFNEQLYLLKGMHSGVVKLKFNRLCNMARSYENEILKWTDNSESIEVVYDQLMDIINEVKEVVTKQEEV